MRRHPYVSRAETPDAVEAVAQGLGKLMVFIPLALLLIVLIAALGPLAIIVVPMAIAKGIQDHKDQNR